MARRNFTHPLVLRLAGETARSHRTIGAALRGEASPATCLQVEQAAKSLGIDLAALREELVRASPPVAA
jgi:hypothetical protein